jgi:amidohydrolase
MKGAIKIRGDIMNQLLTDELRKEILSEKETVIHYRRYLHQHPELSFEEYETSQFIFDEMSKLPNVEVSRPTETSVLVKIVGGTPGKKIGLRADIDALPIQEEREDLDFQSTIDGKMHACGHDGHAAILMTATKILANHADKIEGEVYSIFQHAEELPPGGAQELVATGLFNDFDFIYGHHLFSTIPTGLIDIKTGPCTGNSDRYEVTIYGKGGHAAMPHGADDPVIIGGQILEKFQTIISRRLDPLQSGVISNSVFHAGDRTAVNIIPDTAVLAGSVRSFEASARELIRSEMEHIVQTTCESYGASYDFTYTEGYSSVVNDEKATQVVKKIALDLDPNKVIELPPSLGGEDFSAFSDIVPATYAFIGAGNEEKATDYPHHHPKFALDEESFLTGINLFVSIGLNYSRLAE